MMQGKISNTVCVCVWGVGYGVDMVGVGVGVGVGMGMAVGVGVGVMDDHLDPFFLSFWTACARLLNKRFSR